MSSPDGKEYLFEIGSHKYDENVNQLLTADTVDLIENAGFVWPTGKDNFLRWFNVHPRKIFKRWQKLRWRFLRASLRMARSAA